MAETALQVPLVALMGNPNCGKTALFNALTGSRQKVANYPGVTVERKEGAATTPEGLRLRVLDLPGSYSLRPRSPDEEVALEVVLGRSVTDPRPDVVVCVVDATNLRLNLRLVLELKTVGLPMVLVLNMMDIAQRRGYVLDLEVLRAELGMPVVGTVATRCEGVPEVLSQIDELLAGAPPTVEAPPRPWSPPTPDQVRSFYREVDRILAAASRGEGSGLTFSRRLDQVLLHPVWGLLFLAVLFFVVFQAVFSLAAVPQSWLQAAVGALQRLVQAGLAEGPLRSLLADGIVAGVGSVIVFLPQILILFFFILALEDTGYMARVAFLMDRLMGGVGLHGRAFIPLLSSFACAVPGIMATRTIATRADRLVTILVAPLMTCSARLPVYALIIGAFIPDRVLWGPVRLQGLVLFALYGLGVVFALGVAFVLKRTVLKGPSPPLLMELPAYKVPGARNLALGLLERATIFVRRAGTYILSVMVLLWFMSSYPRPPAGGSPIDYSFAGMLGGLLEPFFSPLGFDRHIVMALVCGLAAREVVVAALGTVYALSETSSKEAATQALSLALLQAWSLPTALAFLAWYVFAPQCMSTLMVTRRETNSWGWTALMFGYMFALAWVAAFVTRHVALFVLGGG